MRWKYNGVVEQADLVLLHWGETASPVPDGWTSQLPLGTIDQDELDAVLLNWGNTAVASASSGAVPEPPAFAIALFVTCLAYCRCRLSAPLRVRRRAGEGRLA
jgi:hypothetical protein